MKRLTKQDKDVISKISKFYREHPDKKLADYQVNRLKDLYNRHGR